ncbi:hypothetical protein J7E24_15765 [Hymenobacter sp. ISL-91]|uniref:hypothetical protein n=1 Tax=Hymenobacter sp. ISL-91 TaxID=2819151 RepID=UPI001BEA610C|nr:hypothetical protein [Hymenobacter sp. ISL-91]MBT2559246.1 hypothetical protein [Hymenobacter sp. ISL-91]
MEDLYLDELEAVWEIETGFLGCLRGGVFDHALYGAFVTTLMRVQVEEGALLPARFVTLLWFVLPFMEQQAEQITATFPRDEYQLAQARIQQQLERILGFP